MYLFILSILFLFNFQVPTETEANVHSRRQEDADIRVQEPDAHAQAGDEAAVVPGRRQRDELPAISL